MPIPSQLLLLLLHCGQNVFTVTHVLNDGFADFFIGDMVGEGDAEVSSDDCRYKYKQDINAIHCMLLLTHTKGTDQKSAYIRSAGDKNNKLSMYIPCF